MFAARLVGRGHDDAFLIIKSHIRLPTKVIATNKDTYVNTATLLSVPIQNCQKQEFLQGLYGDIHGGFEIGSENTIAKCRHSPHTPCQELASTPKA